MSGTATNGAGVTQRTPTSTASTITQPIHDPIACHTQHGYYTVVSPETSAANHLARPGISLSLDNLFDLLREVVRAVHQVDGESGGLGILGELEQRLGDKFSAVVSVRNCRTCLCLSASDVRKVIGKCKAPTDREDNRKGLRGGIVGRGRQARRSSTYVATGVGD